MVERELVVPVAADTLWRALTDPDSVAGWFGADVEWDLAPGGRARWSQPDGERRAGVVEEVAWARRLRFAWWPEGGGTPSEVTFELEPLDEGTRLVVSEQPLREAPAGPQARASSPASAPPGWSPWDTRVAGLWVQAHGRVGARA